MIVAGVIYWRPDVERVRALVASLEGRVHAAVFLDGIYAGMRGPIASRGEERRAIAQAAAAIELPAFVPPAPGFAWSSEPVKRSVCARLAWEEFGVGAGEPASLLVIDADETLESDVPELEEARVGGVAQIDDETPAMRRICAAPYQCASPDCGCPLRPVRRLCRVPREECRNPDCDCEQVFGATMIRHHHLTADLAWGPSHLEVTCRGMRYATPHCLPTNPADFVIRHHGQFLKADREYQRYNDHVRMRVEALGQEGHDDRLAGGAFPTWGFQSRADTIMVTGLSQAEERIRLPLPDDRVTPRGGGAAE